MSFKPYLTSDDIIEAVKRKISLPTYQSTFTEEDILRFANEEMMSSQVPSVLSYHEEYFVTTKEVSLVSNRSRYPIPDRAIGQKLRDLFYRDNAGNLVEMTRIAQDDRAFFQYRSANADLYTYYLEGNDVVMVPDIGSSPTGSLFFVYFLRPNQLVPSDRIATITGFSKTVTVDNTSLTAGDTLTIDDQVFTAVAGAPSANEFQIGATSNISAANLASAVNTNTVAVATVASNVVTLTYLTLSISVTSSDSSALSVQSTQGLVCDQAPTNITEGSNVDFLQTKSGHKTYSLDVPVPLNGISGTTYSFSESLIPDDMVVGDYIAAAEECFIPQIPSDLHISLVERVCARILSAIGDTEGLTVVSQKLQEAELRTGSLIDNRSEGSPQKITQRHSLLRRGKLGARRRLF